jgi:hypothetical protein
MFLALMVSAPGSQAPPPRGAQSMIFSVNDGRSRISGTASHGTRRQYFLSLMVGATGSLSLPP